VLKNRAHPGFFNTVDGFRDYLTRGNAGEVQVLLALARELRHIRAARAATDGPLARPFLAP